MAYDPKDPADVKIVTDAVAAALAEAEETHEADVAGLKAKNAQLLGQIKTLRTNGGVENAGEIERLETEVAEVNTKLRATETELRNIKRDLATVTTERDTTRASLETETTVARDLLVNNGLTAALVEAKVKPEFLEDVTASLARQVVVKEVEGKRQAFVGDKPLGEFIKEWAVGDKGKHYVGAAANGGGNANPGNPSGGSKKIAEMSEPERIAHHRAIGDAAFTAQVDAEKAAAG